MKILLTADWHFDCNNRLEDFVASTNQMVDYALKNDIHHFFIVGDVYRNWKPSTVERDALYGVLSKLVQSNIRVVIVMGNHDVNDKEQNFIQHALGEFGDIGHNLIYVATKPEILNVGPGKNVLVIPHLAKAYLMDLISYRAAFIDALTMSGDYELVLSHTLFFDGISGPCDGSDPRGIALSDIKGKLRKPMFMGDIHGHKVLQAEPTVAYISSPERITFNEIDDQKGFVVYDLETKKHEFITLPTRKFFQITFDLDAKEFGFHGVAGSGKAPIDEGDRTDILVAIIKAVADNIQDAVVKLVVVGHKQDLALINRHAVVSHLKECKPYKIVKISFDTSDDTVARDTGFTGHLTAQDAFRKWSEKQVYEDKNLGMCVFSAGMEILNEA